MNPLGPVAQTAWERLAVANFFLGGAGGGLYVVAAILRGLDPQPGAAVAFETAGLLGPALVVIGFLAVAAEAGRPLRGANVLLNLRLSWMSRELAAGLSFIVLAGTDRLYPNSPLEWPAVAAAVAFVVSQGFILREARGVPAWNLKLIPLLFLTSGCLAGAGVLLAVSPLAGLGRGVAGPLVMVVLAAAGANLAVWIVYLRRAEVRALLNTWPMMAGVVGIGHLLPVGLIAVGQGLAAPSAFVPVLSGAAILAGGLGLKDGLVTRAGRLVAMRPPARGAASLRPLAPK